MDPAETHLVLGTAGHIDHGKTALIRALTGVDTDRLPEEKERGITIDLGFAPLELPGGARLGVVDVPGHEGLVRTMVSGATGIDLVLLVVAADEGVMPQTREHLAICELLGITRGVVALTRIDRAADELQELAAEEVRDLLAGTGLAGAPIVPVCAPTGEGLDALRDALDGAVAGAAPRTPRGGRPRLAVDRCFSARGFGCVVTGTLVGGAFAVGDAVEIQPAGRPARVRGLQSHGIAAERREAGVRCAVNLQGVEVSHVARGDVVCAPGALAPTRTLDVRLAWLDVAPPLEAPLSVELLTGTAERRARLAPVGAPRIAPGQAGFARVHVDGEPLPACPGDAFIVRGFHRTAMGGSTLGGGTVLDTAPPHRRRSDPALRRDLERLAQREPRLDLEVRIGRAGFAGMSRERLLRETGLEAAAAEGALRALSDDGLAAQTPGDHWIAREALGELEERLVAALHRYHAAEPVRPGMPRAALHGTLPDNVSVEVAELARERLRERGALVCEGDLVRLPGHAPTLSERERGVVKRLLEEARAAGLEPPGAREWAERLGVSVERFRELASHLERENELVRAPGDLWYHAEAVSALRERVIGHLRTHGTLETPSYKALIGTTRRTAVPLMELFDEERLTIRRGTARLLRDRSSGSG